MKTILFTFVLLLTLGASPAFAAPGDFVCSDNFSATSNDFQVWLNNNCDNTKSFTETWVELGGNSYITGCCVQK